MIQFAAAENHYKFGGPYRLASIPDMKKLIIASSLLVSAAAFAQTPAPAAGDAAAGKRKAAAVCSGCHGIPGTKTAFPEVYMVPKLGGQSAGYIAAALKAYKAGERGNPTMKGLTNTLTDKDIADVAAYYSQK